MKLNPSQTTSDLQHEVTEKPSINGILTYISKDIKGCETSVTKSIPVPDTDNWKDVLSMLRISLTENYTQPPVCIEIVDKNGPCRFGTLGNFSAIIGKAKSRKTFFLSLIMGAAMNENVNGLKVTLPENQKRIVYFDTEQANFDVSRVVKRILTLGEQVNPDTFEVYGLRTLTTQQRSLIIEQKIYNTNDIGIVVIDGIRDLINDINSPEEATNITSKLLKWTEERNIHIVTILHQNKGDGHARGHVGSEIVNKAESVISVEKEDEVSIVRPEFTRGKDFQQFAFGVDEREIPYILTDWIPKKDGEGKKRLSPYDLPRETHLKVLQAILTNGQQMKRKDLETNLSLQFKSYSIGLTTKEVCEYIAYYLNNNLLKDTGGKGRAGNHFYLSDSLIT